MEARISPKGVTITEHRDDAPILVTHNLNLSEVRGGLEAFEEDAFFSCTCLSSREKSSDHARIRDKQSGKPIGWYIPSLYFSEPDQFLDVKYLPDFAYAAFLHFWRREVRAESQFFANPPFKDGFAEFQFFELFAENIGFLVFSKVALKESHLSLSDLKISLLRNGIFPLDESMRYGDLENAARIALSTFPSNATNKINIHRLPEASRNVGALLSSVLSMAHGELSGIGGFLYLYQIAEHLTEVKFASLVKETSGLSLPPWKLKEKLSDITSERYRLKKIAHSAGECGANMAIFDTLGDECKSFLRATNVLPEEKNKTWIEWVYDVRNLIVHNHLAILRAGTSNRLEKINSLLHRSALELIIFCSPP